ncbi:bifunctional riboflavin kinase/FAD synthetase [Christensenellaceae bacterium OttesenSCG-928-L17]|nr:bifunctional riboflavin kinase/FAD synthetase [Christensenellaceae bacterium OttesenSCG-928-L17]
MTQRKTKTNEIERNANEVVLVLGMFDGVHTGHQALLKEAARLAHAYRCKSAAYTFLAHPGVVLGRAPLMLNTADEREALLRRAGMDTVYMREFTPAVAALSPEDFVQELCAQARVRAMVVGFNYTFGHRGAGNADTLRALGNALGFETVVLPPVLYKGVPVSSSRIRECVECGSVEDANNMLGYPYTMQGEVVKNRHIGTGLGFPTANILPQEGKALLMSGVYITRAYTEEGDFAAITNIGTNPTVQGKKISIETNLFAYEGNLYGKRVRLAFHRYLRGEKKFENKEQLAAQIARDVAQAKLYWEEEHTQNAPNLER